MPQHTVRFTEKVWKDISEHQPPNMSMSKFLEKLLDLGLFVYVGDELKNDTKRDGEGPSGNAA